MKKNQFKFFRGLPIDTLGKKIRSAQELLEKFKAEINITNYYDHLNGDFMIVNQPTADILSGVSGFTHYENIYNF